MAIHVLLDTNVFIGHLLGSRRTATAVNRMFAAVLSGSIALVLPKVVEEEVLEKIRSKPALSSIDVAAAEQFLADARLIAVSAPHDTIAVTPVTRDPDDDVVLAYALAAGVDYLITGDKDLLVLADVFNPMKIRTPQALLEELEDDPTE